MAIMRVNPNRMELMRLRSQLLVAKRGHKLLKDKRDELMRQFLAIVKENQELRKEVERLLKIYNQEMVLARAVMREEVIETALYSGHNDFVVEVKEKNLMSLRVPEYIMYEEKTDDQQKPEMTRNKTSLPYGLAGVSGELDQAILALMQAVPAMIELATIEKRTQLLAQEIEKMRRRVNSLEHRMIPDLEETIHSITMKMEENERANITRLMKVKDLILEKEITERRRRDESIKYQ